MSKLYKVRSKENGQLFTMEVETRNAGCDTSPYVQETRTIFSQFWVNLRFTFQTRSKFYYILDYVSSQSLASVLKDHGCFPEFVCRFYASEVLNALEELHHAGLVYEELELGNILLDQVGHCVLWRRFCGKGYWSLQECICSQNRPSCAKKHVSAEKSFTEDWRALGGLISLMLTGENCLNTMKQR